MNSVKKLLVCGSLLVSGIAFSQQTETRKLSAFSKLDVGGSFDVIMEKGNEESAKIVAEGISPEKIITEVKGNTLEVSLEKGQYHNIKIKVYLTYKNLESIDKSGSGNLTANSDLSAKDFILNTSGSGNVILNKKIKAQQFTLQKDGSGNIKLNALETDDADLTISGSGNFDISDGHAKKQSIHLSGSGNVSVYGMKSDECIASISGSGDIDVSVSQSLEGLITGSGNITYRGDAQLKRTAIVGSGKIKKS